ncbi:DUF262 domain-containing protein [Paraburkholderia sediminicola]|uniref:DUF262 domain-containing protein n=1 Tax=Paraburkholderia TaxID=1822464 RepID=UPI0038B6E7C2
MPGGLAGLSSLETSSIPSAVSHRVRRRHAVYDGGQVDGNGLPRFGSLSLKSTTICNPRRQGPLIGAVFRAPRGCIFSSIDKWDAAKQLELNPRFQRRPVWTDKAKSFLMDTIIRGKPIPKVFIRQKINVSTKTSMREVVDGQQRLRTILSFIKDGFVINKRQNPESGGVLFSQLPEAVQAQMLAYEVSVDLLINLPDSEVLDIFSRLNSYAVVLNEQEKINADHFGPFKVLADKVGHKYYDYWTTQGILTSKQIMRMQEVNLVADLLIAMLEGIKSKKQVKKFCDAYETNFDYDTDALESKFDLVIAAIATIYPEGLSDTEFRRPNLFYSLFTAVAHREIGIPGLAQELRPGNPSPEVARNKLERVEEIFSTTELGKLPKEEQEFLQDARRATTDEKVRARRTTFLLKLMS